MVSCIMHILYSHKGSHTLYIILYVTLYSFHHVSYSTRLHVLIIYDNFVLLIYTDFLYGTVMHCCTFCVHILSHTMLSITHILFLFTRFFPWQLFRCNVDTWWTLLVPYCVSLSLHIYS